MHTAIINHLEALASFYLGTPWQDNAGGPDAFDCWHWVRFCLVEIGYPVPENVWMAKRGFRRVPAPGQPGDLLHFSPPGATRDHVGLKLRHPWFSGCGQLTGGVSLHELTRPPWQASLKGTWRWQEVPVCA